VALQAVHVRKQVSTLRRLKALVEDHQPICDAIFKVCKVLIVIYRRKALKLGHRKVRWNAMVDHFCSHSRSRHVRRHRCWHQLLQNTTSVMVRFETAI
jgi:hypothetical protein